MKYLLFWRLYLLILSDIYTQGHVTYIEPRYPLKGERSPPGSPWPLPRTWTRMTLQYSLSPDHFELKSSLNCEIIEAALLRYRGLIFIDRSKTISPKHKELESLKVHIDDTRCGYPKFGDNEKYSLTVPDKDASASLRAKTVWGALRGLETFSQLVYIDEKTGYYLINSTRIEDWPRFSYRGVMVDTARHFIPMKVLLKNLDAMSWNKFNVFHWHIIDDQSFPMESKVFPNLTKLGAYNDRLIYTQRDIKKLIEYARFRGIRVIPEIDTPGHTKVMGRAFPSLLTTCYDGDTPAQSVYGKHSSHENLNPARNETFEILRQLYTEVKNLFPDDFIHLGMDEAYYDCWQSSPEIRNFMDTKRFTEMKQVEKYYIDRTLENIKNLGYKYIVWQDPIDNNVSISKDAIVEVWKGGPHHEKDGWKRHVKEIIARRHKIILSSCWYLNYIHYGEDWRSYYNCDPVLGVNATDEEKEFILGGEACMWSEYVDQVNLLSKLWPRASAVAERLWSRPGDTNDSDSALFRLDEQRCRMLRRGVEAQPLTNGYCGSWELDLQFGTLYSSSTMIIVNNQSLFLSSCVLLIYFIAVFKSF
uniref:Beta-hexosaminidase n=1 Tax=Tetranychus evansi TaxID=178897 RepID=A0A3G5ARS4_9ACAR|nr:beta-hexosaminidase subunit alpha isoform X1 [Tetranychus evansi]